MASITEKMPFGIVTVMDVKVFGMDQPLTVGGTASTIENLYKADVDRAAFNAALIDMAKAAPATGDKLLCTLDHLQVATLSTEGPSIEIQGGKYNNKLIKYGKTARCEMTDVLGQMDALVALGGAEYSKSNGAITGIVVTDKFGGPVCIVGDSFVVDKKTGKHVPVKVILYEFLPDSTPSFAFDSGNAATFDLNGDLLAVEFADDNSANACGDGSGAFFAIEFDSCEL